MPSRPPAAVDAAAGRGSRLGSAAHRQALWVLGVLTVVVLTDQVTKAWAWRHEPTAVMNTGSTWFLGRTISSWYRGDLSGALLDAASTQVLAFSLFTLLRRRRPLPVLLPATLMISGWVSNLGDRLGLHLLTAPGMPRGAIDFIHWGHCILNIADLCIAAGTLLLGAALYRQHRGHAAAPAPASAAPAVRSRPWRLARRWALLAAVTPALLATAATLTAPQGHLHATDVPVIHRPAPTPAAIPLPLDDNR